MRVRSENTMQEILKFINIYYVQNNKMPTLDVIATRFRVHKTTIMRYLEEMNTLGMVEYDGKLVTTTEITEKCTTKYVPVPIVGEIRCGDPTEEEENIEEYVSLPVSLFGTGEMYILRASGDSMVDAGIEDGDLIVIKKTNVARKGDIVVALDAEGENTLKKYTGYSRGKYELSYMNEAKYPDKKIYIPELAVQGIATMVMKNL